MGNPLFARQQASTVSSTPEAAENEMGMIKVLIVDDETEVHRVTDLTLKRFRFDGKKIQFLHAYSGKQAREIFESEPDIALALVDVVMETDHAGLDLVHYVRKELKNGTCRLVLRTGQPGQAPEHEVIERYDINDYKEKTELTSQKLKTLMYTGLRSYHDISTIENHRKGLRQVIESTTKMLQPNSLGEFASAVLKEIMNILQLDSSAVYCSTYIDGNTERNSQTRILAATGTLAHVDDSENQFLPDVVVTCFDKVRKTKQSTHFEEGYVFYTCTESGFENLLYVDTKGPLSESQKELLEIYCINVSLVYENLTICEEISETQKELLYLLGDAVELHSSETSAHVKRVAEISYQLAILVGMTEADAQQIRRSSPLHDLGKIAIPDAILHKPSELTAQEWEVMKTHTQAGYAMLRGSKKPILKMAAEICLTHHEHWDGNGYPQGLSNNDIPLAGRITAMADVFDSLGMERCYRPAWSREQIVAELPRLKGAHLDPSLVDVFLDHIDIFWAIQDKNPE